MQLVIFCMLSHKDIKLILCRNESNDASRGPLLQKGRQSRPEFLSRSSPEEAWNSTRDASAWSDSPVKGMIFLWWIVLLWYFMHYIEKRDRVAISFHRRKEYIWPCRISVKFIDLIKFCRVLLDKTMAHTVLGCHIKLSFLFVYCRCCVTIF